MQEKKNVLTAIALTEKEIKDSLSQQTKEKKIIAGPFVFPDCQNIEGGFYGWVEIEE